MNMQITARTFTSAAEIFAEAAARRQRFESAGKHPKPLIKPPIVAVGLLRRRKKIWERRLCYFDAHVVAWRARQASPALVYLQDRCEQIGVSYQAIIGLDRTRPINSARQMLMWEVWSRYGLSLPRVGKLFHRDHTTILHGIRQFQTKKGQA